MTTKIKIIIGIVIILALLAIVAAIRGWYTGLPKLLTTQWLTAPEIRPAAKVPKVRVPVKEVVTLEKKAVSEKLQLSPEITNNDKKQIVATAEIPPYEGETRAVAVLNTTTGEAEIIAKQQPLSFFALENKKAIGMRWGYGSAASDKTQADIYARWDVVRIGAVHVGLYGEANTTGEGRAMISVEYRF